MIAWWVAGTVVLVLALFAWTAAVRRDTQPAPNLTLVNEGSPQFRDLELRALAGSVEAAEALMEYHSRCHKREDLSPDLTPLRFKQCSATVGFWTDVALENGSLSAAQNRTNTLLESSNCADTHRAEFWYRKFRSAYEDDPVFLKSVSDQIAEKKSSCRW